MADLGDGTMAKARWVVLGYEDPDLGTYATYAPTIRHDSKSWLMILCCHRGYRLRSLDARTAFLAGRASRRARSVYVLPPDDVVEYLVRIYGEKARGPLELLKAAYGLGEAPLAWYEELRGALLKVGFTRSLADHYLFYFRGSARGKDLPSDHKSLPLLGAVGTHVDDLLVIGGGEEFENALMDLQDLLPFGKGREGRLTFCGENYDAITVNGEPQVLVDQKDHVEHISEISVKNKKLSPGSKLSPALITEMKSRNGAVQYIATHCHQHLAFECSYIGGKTKEGAVKQDLLDCNKMVRRAHAHRDHAVRFRQLVPSWHLLRMVDFSDAGWATRVPGHSQCGGLHFTTAPGALKGESAPCCLIDTQCQKITWKTGNAHEAETHAAIMNLRTAELHQFTYFELSHYGVVSVSRFLGLSTGERIFMALVVDNRGLFTQVDIQKLEKKRGIYVFQLVETVERMGAHSYWVNGGHMLADPLTKLPDRCLDAMPAMLDALSSGRLRIAYDTESRKRMISKKSGQIHELAVPKAGIVTADPNDVVGNTFPQCLPTDT